MITQIRSNLEDFHAVAFKSGMNIFLADADKDCDEKASKNESSKTILIRIIHFCFGSDIGRDKTFGHPKADGISFGMTFIWNDRPIMVDRRTNENTVLVSREFLTGIDVEVVELEDGRLRLSLDDWKIVLSARFVPDAEISPGRFSPSFQELLQYLIRSEEAAFNDPSVSFQGQRSPSKQLLTSFLLGLNWSKQREIQDRDKDRKQLILAIKSIQGAQKSINEQLIGDLEAERIALEKRIDRNREEASRFRVRDDYRDIENQLNEVSRELHNHINENHSDQKLLECCRLSTKSAPEAPAEDPVIILKEAGAIFKEETLRSLDEVSRFHRQVYKNRGEFLQSEIDRLDAEIASRNARIDDLSGRKQSLLEILQSSGALETLVELRRNLNDLESQVETLKARIDERKRFDRRKDEIAQEILGIKKLLKRDLDDRREIVDEAIGLFEEYIQKLYGAPGKLVIDVSDKNPGYRFIFKIDRERITGANQILVFCFDLMIATLRARRGQPFTTLIHDSSFFADVDPRQYERALQFAATTSESEGFQYICCMNAGAPPNARLGDLNLYCNY
ncbi:DUF2326 domain-containing protein [Thioalkalivibrio sp. HK1]|uniref:DUF2326 domain-containing protein n=1 Tax=Thioalkalivibrio sp. HK1 TaxID=1469245 RepID=UPI0004719C13|nr:DUF2326 domain-containing protein [Thioalkalivibrio sp. HK1]